jgi:uncharacterized coiled-coil DUF342 family protein
MNRLDQAEREHVQQLVKQAIRLKGKADELHSRVAKLNDKAASLRKHIASREKKGTE